MKWEGDAEMFQLINQPFNGQLGNILKENLSKEKYKYFAIVSAFAKNSGVLRMKESIQAFRRCGGKVEAFIGLDAHGTSYEAACNLFSLVDRLYLVHDRNPSVTFHSKMYYFSDLIQSDWLAVGSNNFTGGGLWTNFESASIVETEVPEIPAIADEVCKLKELLELYKSPDCGYSIYVKDLSELTALLRADILRPEIQLQFDATRPRRNQNGNSDEDNYNPFGTRGKVHIPSVQGSNSNGKRIQIPSLNGSVTSTEPIIPSDNSEKMWFETRAMTGGSRNILDLSMLGKIIQGAGNGTRYETDDNNIVLGSVVFFDVDPSNVTAEKEVTINYNAVDYVGCTIKMHQAGVRPNGSWRIQFKGENTAGVKLTNANRGEWLVHKIIVLEKIQTDYYVMSVLPESDIDKMESKSIFTARNGNGPSAKKYGLLEI